MTGKSLAPVLLGLLSLAASACNGESQAGPPPATHAPMTAMAPPPPPPLAPSRAEPPAAAPTALTGLTLNGDLRPSLAADLSFKTGGQLAVRRVVRGDLVKAGQVLGQLSDVEAQAQLAQAEAAVAMARAQAAIAADQAKRVETLRTADAIPGSQGVASKLQVEAVNAGVRQAEAAVALARANAANHVLRAPFDGMVTRAPEGIGSTVGPGYSVFRIEKLDPLLLVGTVAEAELDLIHVGDSVTLDAGGRTAVGTVRAVVRSLEPVSRRAPVEILVPNPMGEHALVAGAYVRARLGAGQPDATPEVAPRGAGADAVRLEARK